MFMQPFILPLQIPVFSPTYLKFSQVKCSILSFYCTVVFTGSSAKKALKNILFQKTFKDRSGIIANIGIRHYVLKFSKEDCFTHSCYCTVLCAGRSTNESLNPLIHRACLRKDQEILQISVFSLILLTLVKNVSYFLLITLPFIEQV